MAVVSLHIISGNKAISGTLWGHFCYIAPQSNTTLGCEEVGIEVEDIMFLCQGLLFTNLLMVR